MAIGRGGSKVQTKLAFLLYGEQGTWKSTLASQFIKFKRVDGKPFRVLYIDPEQGSIDTYLEQYENEGYDLRNIYIVYTQSISEVKEMIGRAKSNEDFYEFNEDTGEETDTVYLDSDGEPFRPDAIVIDGITLLYVAKQQSMLDFSKKRATVRAKKKELIGMEKEVAVEGAGIEIKDYQVLKFEGQDLILDLLASGKHFAVTCREEDEKESYKDPTSGEIKSMATGRKQPSGFKDVRYNVKTVMRLFKDEDGVIKGIIENKDRTLIHKQDEIIIEPTLLDWQIVIDKNKNKKDFTIANNLDKAVENERKAIEKDNAKFDKEFEDTTNKANDVELNLNTVEDYIEAISLCLKKLSQTAKSKKQGEIEKAELPKAYSKLTNIDDLKKYYGIVSQ